MSMPYRFFRVLFCLLATTLTAQQFSPTLYQDMRWRSIGPHRGGRTRAVAGVPTQPNVFYIGVCNGGVWKTTDYGRTWTPIFDDQPTGSIGAIAVAPSDPNIVYVGSGEGLHRPDLSVGDGIYRSSDAGRTWTHLGLRDGQQIPAMAVDPRDPNRLFVAVLGHPYGPNPERGIYRSIDGGQTFQKMLYKDENTGGSDVEIDPKDPDTIYAALWEAREGPWENAAWAGTSGGIFKSTDGGNTWRPLTKGLPQDIIQANVAIAQSDPKRLYATIAVTRGTGIYRSDDAGETWTQITKDPRPALRIGGGDLPMPKVDPKNPDIVYSGSIVTWRSTDGGKTWTGIRGAPGGDDYQNIWINPNNPNVILLASDQGAIITVNGGESWSSWYNQPTAQLYHVAADNAFPYRVCSGQQESGSVCISSRGNDGEITFREWHPVGADEYAFVAPDPLDSDIVYGGKVTRYDRRNGQVANVSPKPLRGPGMRVLRTEPVLFSPADPHTLFFATNTLWKTGDGGQHWQQISPDLSRPTWPMPASVGKYTPEAQRALEPSTKPAADAVPPTQRGVIYTVAPSVLNASLIWAGTDDGLIHVTRDAGLHWTDVTPKQLVPWAKVSIIDAGHFDALTAYAAINTIRLDDMRPHILRTHDGGKTWTEIVNGLPEFGPVNVVREDPKRKGLLFAGTERELYVSFNDGDHWQPLRLNMAPSSVRDLIDKDNDLVAATHGRGFWILDDITPLRQVTEQVADAPAFLFKPQMATRVRWDMNTDTPLPPDEPAGKNPPDGAILNYYLKEGATGPVTLEILDAAGGVVRHYASTDKPEPLDPNLNIPTYWVRSPQVLSAEAGMHRFVWDLHWQPLPARVRTGFSMQAVANDTPPSPTGPWVMPGQYTVKLTAGGQSYTQPLTVRMDPRVKTPALALQQQFTLSKQLYDDVRAAAEALEQARAMRAQLAQIRPRAQGATADAVSAFDTKLTAIAGAAGGGGEGGGRSGGGGPDTLASVRGQLASLMGVLQQADVAAPTQVVTAVADRRAAFAKLVTVWNTFKAQELPAVNRRLKEAGLPEMTVESQ